MVVYHGSDSNFKQLRISRSLVKHESTEINEGLGIYFSLNQEVAKSYGKYLYTLELNDACVLDFRDRAVCLNYVSEVNNYVYSRTKIFISNYYNFSNLVDYLTWGGISICGTCREIYMLLDSNDFWYSSVSQSKIEQVYRILKTYDKNHLIAYLFNYHIKDIGVIKKIDDSIVKITNKSLSY